MSPRLRRLRGLLLVLGVVLLHVGTMDQLAATVAAWSVDAAMPERLKVAYVREMAAAEPPAVAPVAAPAPAAPPAPRPARQPAAQRPAAVASPEAPEPAEPAASAPELAADTGPRDDDVAPVLRAATAEPALSEPAPEAPPVQAAASVPTSVAAAAASAPVDAASAVPFSWPASTRLSYRLSGQYRGEVHGQAQVEWILAAPRYQVNLDVQVGLAVAPLFSRQMRSDGYLSASGLHPQRYDEDSKLAFRDRRRATVRIDEDGVSLANGQRWTPPATVPGAVPAFPEGSPVSAVQDSASQFVQLSYLFTINPQRLAPGQSISFPLALPRRVEPWVYEVVAAETIYTDFGPVETFHVRPRRGTPRGNDLLAEAWFAPQWAYLPVRIRIEQDAEVFVDLVIVRKPELAGP